MGLPALTIGIVGQMLMKGTSMNHPPLTRTSLENVVNTLYAQTLEDDINIESDARGNVTLSMMDANKNGRIDRVELTHALSNGHAFLTFKDSSARAKDRFLAEVAADQLDRDDGEFDGWVHVGGMRFEKGQLIADLQSGRAVFGKELRVGDEVPANLVALRKRVPQGAFFAIP